MPQTFTVYNPYDLKAIKELQLHSKQEAFEMLDRAKTAFEDPSQTLSPSTRLSILKKLIELITLEQEDFSLLIAQEGGKPLRDARVEAARAISGVEKAIEAIGSLAGQEIPMNLNPASEGKQAFTIREAIGPVLAISAFNHPLNLIIHQAIPAIAAGCPVIVKPALTTPLSCIRLIELIQQAGLPESHCQVCLCEDQIAEEMAASPQISFLSFIGSAKIGWKLKSQVAPGVHCLLEHGGIAPVIIDETADLDSLIPKILKGAFYHAGQVCVSVQRVYAPKAIAHDLAKKLSTEAQKLIVGSAENSKTDIGPIIKTTELKRIENWVAEAIKEGAELLCGGQALSESTYPATVLFNPQDHSKVSKEEIFGPVLSVYSYDHIDEAIERANDTKACFQAAIFTENIKTAFKASRELKATAVMINDHTAFRVDWMPFGGRSNSGYGIGGIAQTVQELSPEKLIVFNFNP